MKTIGIVADNYKLEKFKKKLTKAGFSEFKIIPFVNETSSIKVVVPDNRVLDIKKICELVEIHFKQSN
jgi:hypothetical protein